MNTSEFAEEDHFAFLRLRGRFTFSPLQKGVAQDQSAQRHILHTYMCDAEHLLIHTFSTVELIYLPAQQVLWQIDCASFNFAFDPQRSLLVLAPDALQPLVVVWDLHTGTITHHLRYQNEDQQYEINPNGLTLSPDGQHLAVGLMSDEEAIVAVWDLAQRYLLRTLETKTFDTIMTLAFHPTRPLLAGGSFDDSKVWFWDLVTGSIMYEWEPVRRRVYDIVFNTNGTMLLAGSQTQGLHLWDTETARERSGPQWEESVLWITLAPDETLLAVSMQHQQEIQEAVSLVEMGTWRIVRKFAGSRPSLQFSRDGRFLATSEEDGMVYVWVVATGELLYTVQFYDDGRFEVTKEKRLEE